MSSNEDAVVTLFLTRSVRNTQKQAYMKLKPKATVNTKETANTNLRQTSNPKPLKHRNKKQRSSPEPRIAKDKLTNNFNVGTLAINAAIISQALGLVVLVVKAAFCPNWAIPMWLSGLGQRQTYPQSSVIQNTNLHAQSTLERKRRQHLPHHRQDLIPSGNSAGPDRAVKGTEGTNGVAVGRERETRIFVIASSGLDENYKIAGVTSSRWSHILPFAHDHRPAASSVLVLQWLQNQRKPNPAFPLVHWIFSPEICAPFESENLIMVIFGLYSLKASGAGTSLWCAAHFPFMYRLTLSPATQDRPCKPRFSRRNSCMTTSIIPLIQLNVRRYSRFLCLIRGSRAGWRAGSDWDGHCGPFGCRWRPASPLERRSPFIR
ncbi:hypothetical protein C8J56DRAFT_1030383 [Mycena floridula]|nr:hypothetical protein C8J56DRAFT_1030383 [Mycena floridula]